MSPSQHWMQVDDNDLSSIEYSGDWFLDSPSPAGRQAPGDLYHGTAHGTNSKGGLSFRYEGGALSIWGSSTAVPGDGVSLSCTIDGRLAIVQTNVKAEAIDHYRLCYSSGLQLGRHEVVLNITTRPDVEFWIDAISFHSMPNPNITGEHTLVPPNRPELEYTGDGWVDMFGHLRSGRFTASMDDKLQLKFVGQSVEMFSVLNANMPRHAADATWSIDGGRPVPFIINPYVDNFRRIPANKTRFRVPVFSTTPVPIGEHTLEITYKGNASVVPLSLDYFVVNHGGVRSALPPLTSSSINTTPSQNTIPNPVEALSTAKSPPNTGHIVGGLVGGLVFLGLAAALFTIIVRRRRRYQEYIINRYVHRQSGSFDARDAFRPPPIVIAPVPPSNIGKGHNDETSPLVDLHQQDDLQMTMLGPESAFVNQTNLSTEALMSPARSTEGGLTSATITHFNGSGDYYGPIWRSTIPEPAGEGRGGHPEDAERRHMLR